MAEGGEGTGGSAGSSGGGGTAGGGGSGGMVGVPPDVLERASVVLRYQTDQGTANAYSVASTGGDLRAATLGTHQIVSLTFDREVSRFAAVRATATEPGEVVAGQPGGALRPLGRRPASHRIGLGTGESTYFQRDGNSVSSGGNGICLQGSACCIRVSPFRYCPQDRRPYRRNLLV